MRSRYCNGIPVRLGVVVLATALLVAGPRESGAADALRGDSLWASRAQGHREGRAAPEPIRRAVRAYEEELQAHPHSLEARWKLLRALHFEGEFAAPDEQAVRHSFERAREASETGLRLLDERIGPGERLETLKAQAIRDRLAGADVASSDVARLYFWSAISWGSWSRSVGLLAAVRSGVAGRVHRYARVTVALESEYEDGGAYRLLGRLHAALPRVPFLSGWVDRGQAVPLLERATAIAPSHPGNRLLLGLTLLELAPERRGEALDLLAQVRDLTPRPSMQVEDLTIRNQARELLARADGDDSA
jgi:hypothetical protein